MYLQDEAMDALLEFLQQLEANAVLDADAMAQLNALVALALCSRPELEQVLKTSVKAVFSSSENIYHWTAASGFEFPPTCDQVFTLAQQMMLLVCS